MADLKFSYIIGACKGHTAGRTSCGTDTVKLTEEMIASVLELPSNLEQLAPEKRCVWLKRQHKKLARKWHPDKARGNKERAARKMREVSEAKEALVKRMSC